jgi:hypothetical protein
LNRTKFAKKKNIHPRKKQLKLALLEVWKLGPVGGSAWVSSAGLAVGAACALGGCVHALIVVGAAEKAARAVGRRIALVAAAAVAVRLRLGRLSLWSNWNG